MSAADDAVVNKAADALMFWAKESEPSITALLQDVCWNNQGELHGLEYKFKGKESLLRKIRKDINNMPPWRAGPPDPAWLAPSGPGSSTSPPAAK